MNNRKIIIVTILLILVSAVYLSWTEKKQADLDLDKNWWALSFENPKNSDLSFSIENHSNSDSFHWTVFTAGKTKLKEGDLTIQKGDVTDINLNNQEVNASGKIMIDVASGTDKKEIYKIIPVH
ncbi:MAG: hypothetical protein WCX17_01260 [Parcubacteria group bacterium]|jgi:hypothetical protein